MNCCQNVYYFMTLSPLFLFLIEDHTRTTSWFMPHFFLTFQLMGPYCSHLDFRAKLIFLSGEIVPHDFAKSLGVLYEVK